MKSELVWSERLPGKDNFANTVYDICFKADGQQLLVAIGSRVLVYDAESGDLLHSLKGHRDYVYALAWSRDGKRFASGGADKTIIIWTSKCEGILKYNHNDSIQCLAYNPVTAQLASCTASDFGLWSPEQKSVQKFKINAKALCCAWSNDGQMIAIGQMNGHISIRDKQGNEKCRIERNQPVWSLSMAPVSAKTSGGVDVMAVGCWDQTLSFYDINGVQQSKDRPLGYDPCSVSYYNDGEYLLVAGSNRKASLHTKDGVFLKTVCEKDDWIWTVKARPKTKQLAIGCQDGLLAMHGTSFSTVHGLYQDRYAHRDTMTDVIIQHLITEQKVRIKTRDYVKKIAVYKARLAIQLPDRVLIYETNPNDPNDMHYKLKEKINKQLDCNLLVVTNNNIILCQERKLQLFAFDGRKVREWILEAVIRYIRVVGGPSGSEGLLIGLKNGCVYKIFIDNRFPVKLVTHSAPIRCLDLSASRKKLAVVDENSKVFVYDLLTQAVEFEAANANSVAWNTEFEEMLCFSGNGQLSIRTGNFPLHTQAMQGFVVGFKSSKIFCLHYLSMQTIDVPQSASLYRYIETKDLERAYQVACLGVTDSDWKELALASLMALNFKIARASFIRIRDVRFIELLTKIEITRKQPRKIPQNDAVYLAEILAFQGQYNEAAKIFIKHGRKRRAIEMFLDLRDWARAKEFIEQSTRADAGADAGGDSGGGDESESHYTIMDLLKREANWLLETGDKVGAAEMFWASKDYLTSINILGTHDYHLQLVEKLNELTLETDRPLIVQIANHLKRNNRAKQLKVALLKLQDYGAVIKIIVNEAQSVTVMNEAEPLWREAQSLATTSPQFAPVFWLPYAAYLASLDRFEEAQLAYDKAGKPMESIKMLETLIENSIVERRFHDASYYDYLLSNECWKAYDDSETHSETDWIAKYHHHRRLSELYYAYEFIERYTNEPFTSILPDALFQTAQFVLNALASMGTIAGISQVYSLFALAKQSKVMGAYKLGRLAYAKLLKLKLPLSWRDQVEMSALAIRTAPFHDAEELLPVCYRCSTSNPLLGQEKDFDCCINCKHPFIRSFCSFEILPLVRFRLAQDVSEDEAKKWIAMDPDMVSGGGGGGGGRVSDSNNAQTLSFDDDNSAPSAQSLSFSDRLLHYEPNLEGHYDDITVSSDELKAMQPECVFVRRFPGNNEYYYHTMTDIPVTICPQCQQFFHSEDREFQLLQFHKCPICRTQQEVDGSEPNDGNRSAV